MPKYTVNAYKYDGGNEAGKPFEMTISDDDKTLDLHGQDEGEQEIAHIDGKEYAIKGSDILRVTFTNADGEKVVENMISADIGGETKVLIPAEEDSQFSSDCKILRVKSVRTKEGIEHEKLEAAAQDDDDEKDEEKEDEKADAKEAEKEEIKDEEDDSGGVKFTVDAFKYVGRGPYEESTQMTITDDDDKADWFGKETGEKEQAEFDGQTHDVIGTGVYKLTFTNEDGEEFTENFVFSFVTGQGWMFTPAEEDSHFEGGCRITQYHGWQDTDGVEYDEFSCFANGTLIDTPQGPRAIETLRTGDHILTLGGEAQKIIWANASAIPLSAQIVHADIRPILIPAHALGPGCPSASVRLSPQHRVMLEGAAVELMFGQPRAFAPAHALRGQGGIRRALPQPGLRYHHILLARHAVVTSAGLPSESLFPGAEALHSMSRAARSDFARRFPHLLADPSAYGPTALPCLTAREAKALQTRQNMRKPAHGPAAKTLPDPARTPHLGVAGG